jgi:acetylglutamate kinase
MAKIVIKLGGQVFGQNSTQQVKQLTADLLALQQAGNDLILVHGGGVLIDKELKAQGIEPQKKDGLRITDAATMKVVLQVLDSVNVLLVDSFVEAGLNAYGFNSLNTVLQARPQFSIDITGLEFSLGFVGTVSSVDAQAIKMVLSESCVPLVAPLAIGDDGKTLYNVNADNAASAIAEYIGADMLIFMTDVPGVIGANNIGVKTLRKAHCDHLTAVGTISGGMLPKLHSAFKAAESGVNCIQIIDGTEPHALISCVQKPGAHGTLIA